jgi:hypothetical protein
VDSPRSIRPPAHAHSYLLADKARRLIFGLLWAAGGSQEMFRLGVAGSAISDELSSTSRWIHHAPSKRECADVQCFADITGHCLVLIDPSASFMQRHALLLGQCLQGPA